MVGNNTPVFFFRDPMKFIDLNHAVKRDPRTNLRSANTNWDFWSSLPEALHQVTIVMSDRGLPASYRFMHGFSSHAYSFISADNQRVWVKFHFRSQQGILNLTDQESGKSPPRIANPISVIFTLPSKTAISEMENVCSDHDGGRGQRNALQPLRSDQDLV